MKTPSNGLDSLIRDTVENVLTFREWWLEVLEKGQKEGFTEKELQHIARPLLRDRLARHLIKYLSTKEAMKEASKKQYEKMSNITQSEFYEELATTARFLGESEDEISEAIERKRKEGFSSQGIERFVMEYLKDKIPKDTLNDWLKIETIVLNSVKQCG